MIRFASNGFSFDFCVSSGALGFDGLGWWWERPLRWAGIIDHRPFVVVAKTVTFAPRMGNLRMLHPWTCVRLLPGLGTVNAVGLTNPGIVEWLAGPYRRGLQAGVRLAPSVKPETPDEAAGMAEMLAPKRLGSRHGRVPFVEVNLSCPNVDHVPSDVPEMLRALRSCGHPLVLKLSIDQVRADFVAATDPHVDAFHAVNAIPWDRMYPSDRSPIEVHRHGLRGGVSGPGIRPTAVAAVAELCRLTDRPVVGGGGIFSAEDVAEFEAAGSSAFSIGTCFLHRPWRPNRIESAYRRVHPEDVRAVANP